MLFSSCVTKRIDDGSADIPPNVHVYYYPKGLVWKNLILIIRNEYLMPFDFASYKRGYFVCQEVKDAVNPLFKTRVRLSGSITYDGAGTVVTLYKQISVWNEQTGEWQTTPTDYQLEVNILARLAERLKKYVRKAKPKPGRTSR